MLDRLAKKFQNWCSKQGLPEMSADELVWEPCVTAEQKAWLHAFIAEWEMYEN